MILNLSKKHDKASDQLTHHLVERIEKQNLKFHWSGYHSDTKCKDERKKPLWPFGHPFTSVLNNFKMMLPTNCQLLDVAECKLG